MSNDFACKKANNVRLWLYMRNQQYKDALKRSILDATLRIIEKDGYQAVTIRRIALAIDYSVPTIYEFFENKERLFFELKKEWLQKMLALLKEIRKEEPNPIKALEKISFAYTEYALANGSHYRAVMEAENPSEEFPEIQALRAILKELLRKGNNSVDMLRCYLHGIVSLALTKKISGGESRIYELVTEGIEALVT